MGGPQKLERRRKAGMMNARERVDYLGHDTEYMREH